MSYVQKSADKSLRLGIIGLGYVGLPLALSYTSNGYHVTGFDIDAAKVNSLLEGNSYIEHIPSDSIKQARQNGLLDATTDFSRAPEVDALIICVPTPLDLHHEPDLSYVIGTLESIVPHLRAGQLVSLESTTYPGTTTEEVLPRVPTTGRKVRIYSVERILTIKDIRSSCLECRGADTLCRD